MRLRIVKIGDASCGTGTNDFADVKGVVTCVAPGDDGAAEGVAGAFPEASAAEGVIA